MDYEKFIVINDQNCFGIQTSTQYEWEVSLRLGTLVILVLSVSDQTHEVSMMVQEVI